MDSLLQVIVLSLVQGLTEFLPVSSSAHLILVPTLLGWEDQGLAFDVAVHFGTLLAVIGYFRLEILKMLQDFGDSLRGKGTSVYAKRFWMIGFATIPVGLVGITCRNLVEVYLRSPIVIAVSTLGFAGVLWIADRIGKQRRELNALNRFDVLWIGLLQALSLIPGTSRSGITLTAGLFRGLSREAAAEFSFLLSIPVILCAGGLETLKLLKSSVEVNWGFLGLGVGISAISGYFCIVYFLKLLNKIGLFPFILYRFCLGIFLAWYFYPV